MGWIDFLVFCTEFHRLKTSFAPVYVFFVVFGPNQSRHNFSFFLFSFSFSFSLCLFFFFFGMLQYALWPLIQKFVGKTKWEKGKKEKRKEEKRKEEKRKESITNLDYKTGPFKPILMGLRGMAYKCQCGQGSFLFRM